MRNIDTRRLTLLRRRNLAKQGRHFGVYGRRSLDTSRLTSLHNPRYPIAARYPAAHYRGVDMSRLTSLRRNRGIDPSRLTAFRRNLEPYSTTAYRNNPDWGPNLYNPLEDKDHEFKDDSHYKKTIAKLRRNPVDEDFCPDCGKRRNPEEGTGLFRSIYSRNPDYALRAVTGTNSATGDPGPALYRSLFARRNPPASIQNASNSWIGQGIFKSIFSGRLRRHNPRQRYGRYGV